jgi:hypothetical protein
VDKEVQQLLNKVTPAKRKRDAETMLELMARATGQPPDVDRGMVGYGTYHYKYASGREGVTSAVGFAPRKHALVVYVMDGVDAHTKDLAKLGPHKTGVGCIYLNDLTQNDLAALERIVKRAYKTLTAGTYRLRARDGGKA